MISLSCDEMANFLADCCFSVALFEGVSKRPQEDRHQDFISFKEGETVVVYGVEFSDRPDLWEGQTVSPMHAIRILQKFDRFSKSTQQR